MARQRRGMASLLRLSRCHTVNLQFASRWKNIEYPGVETLPVLNSDSCAASGVAGVRKPLLSELFSRLAQVARTRGIPYFGFINSDVILLREMIEEVNRGRHECYMASRKDMDAEGKLADGYLVQGVDLWIMSVGFHEREGWRLPAAIVGEFGGDNLCASIALTHGDGFLINHRTVCLHETHENRWINSPFAEYNHLQCIRQGYYFSAWARYIAAISAQNAINQSDAEVRRLQQSCFGRKPGWVDHALCKLKLAKWKLIYWSKRKASLRDRTIEGVP